MTLVEFLEWLETQVQSPNWYIGKIDGNKQQCIGIYNTTGAPSRIAIGGVKNTGYAVKAVSILVRWGKFANVAEDKAQEVYNALYGRSAVINGKRLWFNLPHGQPISVGADNEGVFEYVIEVYIYHER